MLSVFQVCESIPVQPARAKQQEYLYNEMLDCVCVPGMRVQPSGAECGGLWPVEPGPARREGEDGGGPPTQAGGGQ